MHFLGQFEQEIEKIIPTLVKKGGNDSKLNHRQPSKIVIAYHTLGFMPWVIWDPWLDPANLQQPQQLRPPSAASSTAIRAWNRRPPCCNSCFIQTIKYTCFARFCTRLYSTISSIYFLLWQPLHRTAFCSNSRALFSEFDARVKEYDNYGSSNLSTCFSAKYKLFLNSSNGR